MTQPPDATTLAWSRLLRAHAAALGAVEAALKAEGHPPLEWYDVLWELERAGPLRPRDLQARLLVAQYNLSRLLDRMEAAGLVAKEPCPDDARGQMVAATEQGRALRARIWPIYAAAIQSAVGDRLTEDEAQALADLLRKLT
jgi:DNA-binding MarR family transcriptional regulator